MKFKAHLCNLVKDSLKIISHCNLNFPVEKLLHLEESLSDIKELKMVNKFNRVL